MKKVKAVFLILVLFIFSGNVYAICDVTESNNLDSLAANVKVNYSIIQIEIPKDENFNYPDGLTEEEREEFVAYDNYYKIEISNLTEELYVIVENKNTNEKTTYTYSNAVDGSVSFTNLVRMEIVDYVIRVYSSDKTNCRDTLLYTYYLTTPMYNPYSELVACEGIEDFYLCHEYLSVDVDFTGFYDEVKNYRNSLKNNDEEETVEEENGFIEFLKNNWVVIIICVVVIGSAGGLITYVVIKKQRSRIV